MPYQHWIPDLLRGYECEVREVDGWRARGSNWFNPSGVVGHHTAGPLKGTRPSLHVVTHGRPDLQGPLCHVYIDRDAVCWVIAAGRANHAGRGGWNGLKGNVSVMGIEVEHTGDDREIWRPEILDVFDRAAAALCDGIGVSADWYCGHKEWAPKRKIDPYALNMGDQRRRINAHINREPVEEDVTYRQGDRNQTVAFFQSALNDELGTDLAVDGIYGRKTREAVVVFQRKLGLADHGEVDWPTGALLLARVRAKA